MKHRTFQQSLASAIDGIAYGLRYEKNMKAHITAAILAIIAGVVLKISRLDWGLLMITIFMVIIAETINTAIEKTIDMVTANYHPLAKIAKNVAAGAVLLSALNALIMAIIIFGPYIIKLL
jgi:diacylglycerol kinase